MNGKFQLLTTTVIGGIVFLVPIIVCIVILGKAFEIMRKLAAPLAHALPIDSVAGCCSGRLDRGHRHCSGLLYRWPGGENHTGCSTHRLVGIQPAV